MTLVFIIIIRVSSVVFKDQINDFITIKMPFFTKCKECRFYNIGILEGIMWGGIISKYL